MTFQEFFDREYKYRSYEQRIGNGCYDYNRLKSKMGSMDALELLCVVAGCNGGVNDAKFQIMKELTGDRAGFGSFASLCRDMHTEYTIKRVCTSFNKDRDTINSAISMVLLFASLKGYLSAEDNQMIDYIYYGK